jgi:hypothetical protein
VRLVRFDNQQRVDLPDLTAVSFLILGEFRRTVRGLLLAPDGAGGYETGILRGFAVTPASVPDSTVTVTLDPGGVNPLGFAVGAENDGVRVDHGQLIGGDNINGDLEGNATQAFDFTGQPVGDYDLQMRYVSSDGANDNRAFWNDGTNSEFVQATDTRVLPAFELGISTAGGSLGAEWIRLATVSWGGATVTAGDITDRREFLFEGDPGTATGATQSLTFGVGDFDRGTDRGASGINEVYPVMRALARQIQDLKGQSAAGTFDWYSRPFAPADGAASSAIPTEQTKSLRTVDVTTYTVGDGATCFGDFNGANGLETCLQHLEDLAAASQMPAYVRIVLRSEATVPFTWNINTAHTLDADCTLEIEGRGGDARQVPIDFDAVPSGAALAVGSASFPSSRLVLRNLRTASSPTQNIQLFGALGGMTVENCDLTGWNASSGTLAVLGASQDGTRIVNSRIVGRIQLFPEDSAFSQTADTAGSVIEQCQIEGVIDCRSLALTDTGSRVVVRGCEFIQAEAHLYGRRGVIEYTAPLGRLIVEDCRFSYHLDQDAIHVRRGSTGGVTPSQLTVRGCTFVTEAAATHAISAGANGLDGTGWAVYADAGTTPFISYASVQDCQILTFDHIDAGGVFLGSVRSFNVSGCSSFGMGHQDVTNATATCVYVAGAGTANGAITGCTFGQWAAGTGEASRTRGIVAADADNLVINACSFDGRDIGGGNVSRVSGVGAACLLSSTEKCTITGCTFERFSSGATTARTTIVVTGTSRQATVTGCTFEQCGICVEINGTQSDFCTVTGCAFNLGASNVAIDIGNSANNCSVTGNAVSASGGGTVIDFNSADNHICTGNRINGGVITVTSGTVWGVVGGGGPTNLNYVT